MFGHEIVAMNKEKRRIAASLRELAKSITDRHLLTERERLELQALKLEQSVRRSAF